MTRAVRFHEYGDSGVLRVEEVPTPRPGPGEVRVEVVAASINPGEAAIRSGRFDSVFPASFPSGQGSDLAGRVAELGEGAVGVELGAEVIGFSDRRSSQATDVVVPVEDLVLKPSSVDWEQAASLYVAGTTAAAAVRAVDVKPGEVVVIAGAAGGVGCIAAQLARHRDAIVVGTASESNHDYLRSIGVIPVTYGEGQVDRIRAAAPAPVDAFIDTHGHGSVEVALELGVDPDRIDTIADFEAPAKYGVKSDGNAVGGGARTIEELAALIVQGALDIPIQAVYPLEQVVEAFDRLASGHVRGKIVLRMQ
jgi:NADPH:quinone reductase